MRFMQVESAGWGGEGTFTAVLLEALRAVESIEFMRVEDAPASRAEPGYAFISNEIYVTFKTDSRTERRRRLGLPWPVRVEVKQMTLGELATRLGTADGVGGARLSRRGDAAVPAHRAHHRPVSTKGYKVVEMVRVYEAGTPAACRS